DRKVKVINKTKTPIFGFYASRTSTNDWEEDILGADVIMPGASLVINIDDGSGACKFDFKGEFEDGDEVVKTNVDVCKIGEFAFTAESHPYGSPRLDCAGSPVHGMCLEQANDRRSYWWLNGTPHDASMDRLSQRALRALATCLCVFSRARWRFEWVY